MASPLNQLSGQHLSCIVKHMVWNILFLFFELYGHIGLLNNFLCGWGNWCLLFFLFPLSFTIGISMDLMQSRSLLIYFNVRNLLLNDSLGSLGTIFEKNHHIF